MPQALLELLRSPLHQRVIEDDGVALVGDRARDDAIGHRQGHDTSNAASDTPVLASSDCRAPARVVRGIWAGRARSTAASRATFTGVAKL